MNPPKRRIAPTLITPSIPKPVVKSGGMPALTGHQYVEGVIDKYSKMIGKDNMNKYEKTMEGIVFNTPAPNGIVNPLATKFYHHHHHKKGKFLKGAFSHVRPKVTVRSGLISIDNGRMVKDFVIRVKQGRY